MKIFNNPKKEDWEEIIQRPSVSNNDLEATVSEIFSEVKKKGDQAIQKYTALFDGVEIENSRVSKEEMTKAASKVSNELKEAIAVAKKNIEKFHRAQVFNPEKIEIDEGITCWQEKRAIQKVGIYIPGGTAPLFSSVLMLAVPATIAGCKEIVLCTPPNKEGEIHPAILYAAKLCGVSQVYKVGGIQAVAGLTFGTETIPKVYKIFGPGNQFVTAAKQFATKFNVAIDMPAGPSELLVFSDDGGIPSFIASDLLSQAEHGIDSQVILVTTSELIAEKTIAEVEKQLQLLPRKEIAQRALENSKIVIVNSEREALNLINEYAPEHLIIISKNEEKFVSKIENAGSIFLGNYTPESAGDYASGTNHTLPTNGFAKQYSGVNTQAYLKTISVQKILKNGIQKIGKTVEIMAENEALMAHKNAVSIRLKTIENEA